MNLTSEIPGQPWDSCRIDSASADTVDVTIASERCTELSFPAENETKRNEGYRFPLIMVSPEGIKTKSVGTFNSFIEDGSASIHCLTFVSKIAGIRAGSGLLIWKRLAPKLSAGGLVDTTSFDRNACCRMCVYSLQEQLHDQIILRMKLLHTPLTGLLSYNRSHFRRCILSLPGAHKAKQRPWPHRTPGLRRRIPHHLRWLACFVHFG